MLFRSVSQSRYLVREMLAPAGVYLTGAVHKFPVLNVLLEGEVTVISIDGVQCG